MHEGEYIMGNKDILRGSSRAHVSMFFMKHSPKCITERKGPRRNSSDYD